MRRLGNFDPIDVSPGRRRRFTVGGALHERIQRSSGGLDVEGIVETIVERLLYEQLNRLREQLNRR